MAVSASITTASSSGSSRRRTTELQLTTAAAATRNVLDRVPVVYYLSRNGHLEHPHFMEVPLSSPHHPLFLRDVITRLNVLRGKGMASMYSWSCKRSYKNGFVWHDLSENDVIYSAHGHHEYVLKGSLLPENAFLDPDVSSQIQPPGTRIHGGGDPECFRPSERRRRNQSCGSIDFSPHEYSVYKAESADRTNAAAADASTQTDDSRRRRRRSSPEIVPAKEEKGKEPHRDEITISPPPSESSPETLETLMKADGRLVLRPETISEEPTAEDRRHSTGKGGKSSMLMQLISCGASLSFKDCGAGQGLGLISQQYKIRLPRTGPTMKMKLEDKEYFSGSIVETTKEEFPAMKLKRSTSYNGGR